MTIKRLVVIVVVCLAWLLVGCDAGVSIGTPGAMQPTTGLATSPATTTASVSLVTATHAVTPSTMTTAPVGTKTTAQSSDDLRLFVEPGAGDAPILNAINAAKSSVALEVYILSDKDVIAALAAAKARGVRVRVMLEQHPFGGGNYNTQSREQLESTGIEFKWTNPTFKLTHAKYLVVDNGAALILTMNLSKAAATSNREYGIVATDPKIVSEAAAIFEADWQRTAYQPRDPRMVVSPINARAQMMALIGSAQKTLLVADEEIEDAGIITAIIAAMKRGVAVQVLLEDPTKVDINADAAAKLRAGGVQAHFQTTPYLHAKLIVADGAHVYIGSVNISAQSLDQNREVGLILDDPRIIETVTRTFGQDWKKSAV